MVRKKVEGSEEQRRAEALKAERAGERPSSRGATTGASKQRTHVPDRASLTHEEKVAPVHRGKQRRGTGEQPERDSGRRTSAEPERSFEGRGSPPYGDAHKQVFQTLVDLERRHGGEGLHLDAVARAANLPREETRTLLHDLVTVHGLVTEVQGGDSPDLGPRYETKPNV